LAVYFESVYLPVLILTQIPSTLFIPLIILKLLDIPLSVISLSGLLLAAGISVNNMIMLFSPSDLPDKGEKQLPDIIAEQLSEISKPILMASVTTLLSTLPLAAAGWGEGSFFLPLSLTLAGGITGSFILLPLYAASAASCAGYARYSKQGSRAERTVCAPQGVQEQETGRICGKKRGEKTDRKSIRN
ncbi:MAG: efflux RND transporter permease subunit, partial [Spirochaetia bacterium]|nr:efflux RND transporter permease subunit [Spirochaetia bacterium]